MRYDGPAQHLRWTSVVKGSLMSKATPAWLSPKGRPWQANNPRRILDNPWFSVDQFDAIAPTGAPADYYVQGFKAHAVGALPLHTDGTVTLVGQWRFPFGRYSWEIPEGGAPKSEAPLDGAKRELREEAGLDAANWRHVLTMQLSNASSDEVAFGYLATGLTPLPRAPDATEDLTIVRAPFRQALRAAVDGHIQDAITVAMLLRVHHMAYEGDLDLEIADAIFGRDIGRV
jgi:8-oxo-dGTP pyrophosphatase MutT (NUDIX family)